VGGIGPVGSSIGQAVDIQPQEDAALGQVVDGRAADQVHLVVIVQSEAQGHVYPFLQEVKLAASFPIWPF
jgi:hypothetical protein